MIYKIENLAKLRHNLRTPINQIVGYCELLIEDDGLPSTYKNDLETIKAAGWQLLETLNDYLSEQNFERNSFDVARLQQDLRTPVSHVLGFAEILMETALEDNRSDALSDLQKIHQAANQWLEIMETNLLPMITAGKFEALQPQPSKLNLNISRLNLGPIGPSLANRNLGNGEFILIAEDDAFNRDILARRVQRYGYKIETACNGLEAWEKLQRRSFDLVLLDMIMPEIEGYEILQRMRSDTRFALIPVLMISGMDQESSIVRCIEAGADDYLTKPCNPIFLRARIRTCLEKKRLRDQEQKTYAALAESQRQLANELHEAGRYVACLTPSVKKANSYQFWV